MYNFVSGCYGTGLLCYANGAVRKRCRVQYFCRQWTEQLRRRNRRYGRRHMQRSTTTRSSSSLRRSRHCLSGPPPKAARSSLTIYLLPRLARRRSTFRAGRALCLREMPISAELALIARTIRPPTRRWRASGARAAKNPQSNGFSLTSNPCLKPSPIPTVTTAEFGAAEAYSLGVGSSLLTGGLNVSTGYSITPPSVDIFGTRSRRRRFRSVQSKAALSYTLTGPTSGQQNVASTNFTITPSSTRHDINHAVRQRAAEARSRRQVLTVSGTTPVTFTYTNPGHRQFYDFTATSAMGATISGRPITYVTQRVVSMDLCPERHGTHSKLRNNADRTLSSPVTAGDLIVVPITTWHVGSISSISRQQGEHLHEGGQFDQRWRHFHGDLVHHSSHWRQRFCCYGRTDL